VKKQFKKKREKPISELVIRIYIPMSISAPPKISDQTVSPIAKAGNSPAQLMPEFLSSFDAYYKVENSEVDDREGNNEKKTESTFQKNDAEVAQKTGSPEIFKLLKKYRFQDFLQLALSHNDLILAKLIRENRKMRGVSLAIPVSDKYTENHHFVNRVKEHYTNVNWLMRSKPGKRYTGVL
jgi:hypothetical protein